MVDSIRNKFKKLFNEEPLIIRSPGRVNLIGEHTDYNNGFVLPASIDKAMYFTLTPRNDETVKLFALDMNDSYEFDISKPVYTNKGWPNYLMGVVDQLNKLNYRLKGFNCVFGGNIPIGAGLSSSAAIEAGLAYTLNYIFNLGIDRLSLVKLAQKAENEFVGVKCGIMDQYINIFGKNGNVLKIDCQSLECEYYPFEFDNVSIVLFDTKVSHSLASSEYNQRRMECNTGVEIIKQKYPFVKSLRDVSLQLIKEYESILETVVYNRCKYAVEENYRLLNACNCLVEGDLQSFGELMYKTHEGLSKDYEVSCEELDYLVELTKDNSKVYGSRMMGGGFGGCTINLIENDELGNAVEKIRESYNNKFGKEPGIYITNISNGTEIIGA